MEPLPRPPDGDQNRGSDLLAMWWTEVAACVIMVTMRLYSRSQMKNFGLDDLFITIALVLFLAATIALTVSVKHGGARHLYFLKPPEIEYVLKLTWIQNPFGIMSQVAAKMSVAFLLLRLIGKSQWQKWSLYVTIAMTFVIGALSCILTFVQCNPPRVLWEGPAKVPGAKCWKPERQTDWAIFAGSFFTLVDFFLALLPIIFLSSLHLDIRKKLALSVLLGMGVFAGICAAIKTSYLHQLSSRADFTWGTYDLAAWTGAELLLLIVCACIPTLKPIYDLIRETPLFSLSYFRSSKQSSSSYQKYASEGPVHPSGQSQGSERSKNHLGASARVTSRPIDPSVDQYQEGLVQMGNINVQKGWEVQTRFVESDRGSNDSSVGQGSGRRLKGSELV